MNTSGLMSIKLINLSNSTNSKPTDIQIDLEPDLNEQAHVIIAAKRIERSTKNCFNGKIEHPEICADGQIIAFWDFSEKIQEMSWN